MKKSLLYSLFLIPVVAVLSSCQSNNFMPMLSHQTYYLDYKEAGQGKVFITEANSVSFEYEPLGSILIVEYPGYVKVSDPSGEVQEEKKKLFAANLYNNKESNFKFQPASIQSAMNYAVEKALALGGDGIINLKFSSDFNATTNVVQISGMVIKRN
ncbi:hypothetical protein [uncultured Duncaniella sp.]|uniref:hypothetical protein n=1 Tax=uncultured Duncaniella sp. TaxID=2768039 RepID=UPI0025AA2769|nr:hypothetical protein [uncultured Duncaniella sp.]